MKKLLTITSIILILASCEPGKYEYRIKQNVDYIKHLSDSTILYHDIPICINVYKKEYRLNTQIEYVDYFETEYGSYEYIDSIKCIEYEKAKKIVDNLEKLNNGGCGR